MKKTILSGVILTAITSTCTIATPFTPMVMPERTGTFVPSVQSPQGVKGTFTLYDGTDDSRLLLGFKQNYIYDMDAIASNVEQNRADINTKVDQNVYSADQTRQDNDIASKASASDLHADEQKITSNRTAIQKNATQEQTDFRVLQSGVAHAEDTGAYAQSRADAVYANTEKNRKALDATNKRVAANTTKLQNHESRIQDLEADRGYGSKFNDLKNTVDNNRKHASAGIAGVAAMANIPQVSQSATFSMGAGAGTYDGEQGLAVGASARIGQQVVTKLTVSATTENDFVAGMGAAYEW
ncbi:YadA C-terminal domain-containing protein [Lelliottia amnigena]